MNSCQLGVMYSAHWLFLQSRKPKMLELRRDSEAIRLFGGTSAEEVRVQEDAQVTAGILSPVN